MKIDNTEVNIIKIKKILSEYYGLSRFEFKKYLTFTGIQYKITFQPHGYYFIYFKKNKMLFCKSLFPNWSSDVPDNGDQHKFDDNLITWLKSIKKTQIRKNLINVSIKDGAEKRKQFEEKVKKI